MFINYLPGVPDYCSLQSFVDDSKLHLSFPVKDINSAARQITEDLKEVASWCCQNSLLINPDKTKLLLIGTRQEGTYALFKTRYLKQGCLYYFCLCNSENQRLCYGYVVKILRIYSFIVLFFNVLMFYSSDIDDTCI